MSAASEPASGSSTGHAPEPPAGALHVTAGILERATPAAMGVGAARGVEVLLARRTRPPDLAGLWEFPGGKVEPGEAPTAALARELLEELGIEVQVGAFVARSVDAERARPLALDAYRCALVRGAPRPSSVQRTHDAIVWVSAVELVALTERAALAPLDVPLVHAYLAYTSAAGRRSEGPA